MNKYSKMDLFPKLRFPEFHQEWLCINLGKLFLNRQETGFLKLPLMSLTDEFGIIPQSNFNKRDSSNSDKSKYLRICSGDVVYNTMRMWQGRCAYSTIEGIVSPAYTVCTPRESCVGLFFYYYFKTNALIKKFHANSQGLVSDTLNLKYDAFSKIETAYPSQKEEQKKIADCLSSLDDLISAEGKKLKALNDHKKGLMQKLFPAEGKTVPELRFPEFRGSGEWEISRLGQLLKIGNGKDYKHLNVGNIPVYGSGGYMTSVDDYIYDGESVCIGRKGTIDRPLFLTGKFWTVDTLFYTHSFNYCLPKFAYIIFQNINWLKHNEAGGIPSLSKTNIENIEIFSTSLPEQQKIADCLSSLDDLISAEGKKLKALNDHKKGLMQGLFPSVTEVEE